MRSVLAFFKVNKNSYQPVTSSPVDSFSIRRQYWIPGFLEHLIGVVGHAALREIPSLKQFHGFHGVHDDLNVVPEALTQ